MSGKNYKKYKKIFFQILNSISKNFLYYFKLEEKILIMVLNQRNI
jgi:hypothetical protein